MGTSANYNMPTTPQWRNLKNKVTRSLSENNGRATDSIAAEVIKDFLSASKSGGNKKSYMMPTKNMMLKIGAFLDLAYSKGLSVASKEYLGIENIQGKSITELELSILEYLSDDESLIMQVDAQNAATDLFDYILEDAETADEVEELMNSNLSNNDSIKSVQLFFAFYIYETFCRSFYENLSAKVGEDSAKGYLSDIKDYIISSVEGFNSTKSILKINWNSSQAKQQINLLCEEVISVYGGV